MRTVRQRRENQWGGIKLLRKFMAVIASGAVPVITVGIAQVATSGNAFAKGKATTCTGAPGTVTFAPPGLSDLGTASAEREVDHEDGIRCHHVYR